MFNQIAKEFNQNLMYKCIENSLYIARILDEETKMLRWSH